VDPDALAAWLAPDGLTGIVEQLEARVGGTYRFVLTYEDPRGRTAPDVDVVDGRFVELVRA
jgi:uncharacterized protein YndB with AHSA1/START domain